MSRYYKLRLHNNIKLLRTTSSQYQGITNYVFTISMYYELRRHNIKVLRTTSSQCQSITNYVVTISRYYELRLHNINVLLTTSSQCQVVYEVFQPSNTPHSSFVSWDICYQCNLSYRIVSIVLAMDPRPESTEGGYGGLLRCLVQGFSDQSKKFDDVNKKFDDANKKFDGRFDEINKKFDEVNKKLDRQNEKLDKTSDYQHKKLDKQSEKLDKQSEKLDKQNEKFDDLKTSVTNLRKKVDEQIKQCNDLHTEHRLVAERVTGLEIINQTNKMVIDRHDKSIESLNQQREEKSKLIPVQATSDK
ncbi:hypothetical protein LOTGIDRAFT_162783 [Lottia gigantea]|uniref:t-SNARE coiled-coil homology domain-containing protein n=1 Tax=Lottia gigantea TaxID=225164 RepID=V4A5Y3_LOTGI|nr:hypothetical protein LOTGIDRAFT_162783 [Lottia gigantea]ESO92132.1 hypothetical protein LOTGIDRAFT_162783 [Lottia gigantea]